ncbi:hypothetical protein EDEG_00577 [Edhazardia aedis USNM 41457]|uniref:Histidine kinase/HSP90-like ATPase domain-containing protein n=1 Tax=Edhazardia aedis (strain USNM 41457) TaxID=1003232 RepID=J9DD31_EDHAE|nr:hypothetical protein EDEG_00577 [Edhazardia aedis USNM 41457]|eukprot:EJW05379.1 hypothetical protein EDEG_00577 [Edhazardia aedis USNM 41457]
MRHIYFTKNTKISYIKKKLPVDPSKMFAETCSFPLNEKKSKDGRELRFSVMRGENSIQVRKLYNAVLHMLTLAKLACCFTEQQDRKRFVVDQHEITIGPKLIENVTSGYLKRSFPYVDEVICNAMDANTRRTHILKNLDADRGCDIIVTLIKKGELYNTVDFSHVYEQLNDEEAKDENNTSEGVSSKYPNAALAASDMIIFRDFGCGMDIDTLKTKLTSIGSTSNAGKEMIGRFGWGFFSIFSECRQATVRTKAIGSDTMYEVTLCPSSSSNKFEIVGVKDDFEEGTMIICYVNDNIHATEKDILDRIRSDFIGDVRFRNYSIKMSKSVNFLRDEYNNLKNQLISDVEKREKDVQQKNDEIKSEEENLEKMAKDLEEKELKILKEKNCKTRKKIKNQKMKKKKKIAR